MIIQFRFENFRSFRQSALIRLQATGSKSHPHHLAALPCGQILKNLAIYGPNASGKSQLINAFHPPSFQPASGNPLSRIRRSGFFQHAVLQPWTHF